MQHCIGVRREDKSDWERRTPITPAVAAPLREQHGIQVVVQPAPQRAFTAAEFEAAGAQVQEDLSGCPVVLGIKEIPKSAFLPGQAYVFFAHVIKGQPFNMPMLQRMLDLGCTLIDYEKVTDDAGRRLIFFGWHAGVAGMLETLWTLGQRLAWQGVANPFSALRRAYEYHDIAEAKAALQQVAEAIRRDGLPAEITPLTIGVAGYGNVARGVWEILDLLPVQRVEPGELKGLDTLRYSTNVIYATTFREEHLAAPLAADAVFDLQHYYSTPHAYRSDFEQYLPHLGVLVNAIYWDPRYPRLVTKAYLRQAWGAGQPKLRVIGDISCDIDGAIECTVKATEPGDPNFVFNPLTGEVHDGVEGAGLVVMAVDILPSELPRDASDYFSQVLLPYVPALAHADYSASFDHLTLPPEIKRAVIAHRGELTPGYRYLQQHLPSAQD
ncbi:MAG: bifunctional lysine ketoglutarate reductase /saccharopine dehydrogenase family protein [Anaerolineae bacterium]